MAYENRKYLIIPTLITGSIDFNQVHETSSETLRLSVDGTKTFVKICQMTGKIIIDHLQPPTAFKPLSSAGLHSFKIMIVVHEKFNLMKSNLNTLTQAILISGVLQFA